MPSSNHRCVSLPDVGGCPQCSALGGDFRPNASSDVLRGGGQFIRLGLRIVVLLWPLGDSREHPLEVVAEIQCLVTCLRRRFAYRSPISWAVVLGTFINGGYSYTSGSERSVQGGEEELP
jgi:hypothetical protein